MNDYVTGSAGAGSPRNHSFRESNAKQTMATDVSCGRERDRIPEQAHATLRSATVSPIMEIQGRLRALMNFVNNETESFREIGHKLRNHSDALYGEEPKALTEDNVSRPSILDPMPLHNGELGMAYALLSEFETLIWQMVDTHRYIAEQAGRASTFV